MNYLPQARENQVSKVYQIEIICYSSFFCWEDERGQSGRNRSKKGGNITALSS